VDHLEEEPLAGHDGLQGAVREPWVEISRFGTPAK
jgi:hypothetical protein